MTRVLFICIHNSARSQIGEAYLKELGGERFEVESAGIEPGSLNPHVVKALQEDGIDIRNKRTKSVFDLAKRGRVFDYVIAVCSKEAAERCPIFPGKGVRLHWPFPDPSTFTGSDDEIMAQVREVRDSIKARVQVFLHEEVSPAE